MFIKKADKTEIIRKLKPKGKFSLVFKIIGWILMAGIPFFYVYVMDYMNFYQYNGEATPMTFFHKHPMSYLFELIVIATVMILLILLCRKLWIPAAVLGAVSFIMAYANFAKISQNGNNLYPRDVGMLKNAGELLSFVSTPPPSLFWLFLLIAAVWVVLIALSGAELPVKWFIRCPVALVLAAVLIFSVSGPQRSSKVLGTFDMSYFNAALQSSNYRANGFTGAFMINLLSMQVTKPENYSEEYIRSLLEEYEDDSFESGDGKTGNVNNDKTDGVKNDKKAGEDNKGKDAEKASSDKDDMFDVIVVLSESFCDLRKVDGLKFSKDPLKNYDRMINDPKCWSGSLYLNSIGGGTVYTEFAILTGLSTKCFPSGVVPYEYVKKDIKTYVSDFADLGYHTTALHLYDRNFYDRDRAYGYIGFDEYRAQDEIKDLAAYPQYKRGYATDTTTMKAIRHCMEKYENDGPQFLSVITIQNHQPYEKIDDSQISVRVQCDKLDESELTAVTTYTQGLYDEDQMLGELKKYIDSRKRPTLLVYYGDHLPSLGLNFSVFEKCGYFNDDLTFENRERMYSTPFLIYSNRNLKSGMFEEHKGNKISTYNLLNAAADLIGMEKTPYMKLLEDFYREQPMYDSILCIPENESIKKFNDAMQNIVYDRVVGKGYSQEK